MGLKWYRRMDREIELRSQRKFLAKKSTKINAEKSDMSVEDAIAMIGSFNQALVAETESVLA